MATPAEPILVSDQESILRSGRYDVSHKYDSKNAKVNRRHYQHGGATNGARNKGKVESSIPQANSGGVALKWQEVSASAVIEKGGNSCFSKKLREVRTILRGMSGELPARSFTALMGPSGAGKTTLMNILAQRNLSNITWGGKIRLNENLVEATMMHASSGYVQQHELFIGTITVREHLTFQIGLRLSAESKLTRAQRLNDILSAMGLEKCADTFIGVPGSLKGISGGELKRLNLATELINDPPLLFCDEPTTGVDSYIAESIVNILRDLTLQGRARNPRNQSAREGKTIICTIHQPSSRIYNLFDRVLLMSDGDLAFHGPRRLLTPFFEICGFPCPPNFNPADHVIREIVKQSRPQQGLEASSCGGVKRICFRDEFDKFCERDEGKENVHHKQGFNTLLDDKGEALTESQAREWMKAAAGGGEKDTPRGAHKMGRSTSESSEDPWFDESLRDDVFNDHSESGNWSETESQMRKRADKRKDPFAVSRTHRRHSAPFWLQLKLLLWRNYLINKRDRRVLVTRVIQLIVIGAFISATYWMPEITQHSVMDLNGVMFILQSNMSWQNAFAALRLFLEECSVIINEHREGLYSSAAYYLSKVITLMGPFTAIPFIWVTYTYFTIAALVCMTWCTVAFGCLMAHVSRNLTVIVMAGTSYVVATGIASGLVLNMASIPWYLNWLPFVGWYRYTNEIFVVNQWSRIGDIPCPNITSDTTKRCLFPTGQSVIEYYAFGRELSVEGDFILLNTVTLVFHLIAFCLLNLRLYRSR